MTRRAAFLAMASATGASAHAAAGETSFRYRIETVDAIFERVKAARSQQKIRRPAYTSMVEILRDEEIAISKEADAYAFKDLTESNYWHRGRLKFTSVLETELRQLEEGKVPAVHPQ